PAPQDSRLNTEPPISSYEAIAAAAAAGAATPAAEPPAGATAVFTPEDESVRCMLEARLSRLIWDDMRSRNPAAANIMRNLTRLGLTPPVVETLMARAGDVRELENSWAGPIRWLKESIPVTAADLVMHGGVFAVAGPTGVGKTTSIAKLAARYALHNNADDIALVSADNYRIGAREQLETFARIINVPVYSVPDAAKLDQVLSGIDKRLVLVDTAGMGQRDERMRDQLVALRESSADISLLLALPANAQTATNQEIIDVFAPANPEAAILTKVDEATSLGGALSALISADLPLAYICDGQRVPEDLHLAVQKLSWIVKLAMDCMKDHAGRIGKDEMAQRFIKVAVNA
ncbi:MAG: flagellar biosynthesis protein FlhF, partial [Gammaproteobacteria bacterium]|nr:flagellar biosynthesis protein FlhF [Gammaproteobacteria bacterium]